MARLPRLLLITPHAPSLQGSISAARVARHCQMLGSATELTCLVLNNDPTVAMDAAGTLNCTHLLVAPHGSLTRSPQMQGVAGRMAAYLGSAPAALRHIDRLAVRETVNSLPATSFDIVLAHRLSAADWYEKAAPYMDEQAPMVALDLEAIDSDHLHHALATRDDLGLMWRWRLHGHAWQVKRFENHVMSRWPMIFCTDEDERRALQARSRYARILTLPNTVPVIAAPEPRTPDESPILFLFVGNAKDRDVNAGLNWLLKFIWPNLWQSLEQRARLVLLDSSLGNGFERLGNTEQGILLAPADVGPEEGYAQTDIVLVPRIQRASGQEAILAAMAAGRAVIATTIGASGLDVPEGVAILTANAPSAFIKAAETLALDSEIRDAQAAQGHAFVQQNYDYAAVGQWLRGTLLGLTPGA